MQKIKTWMSDAQKMQIAIDDVKLSLQDFIHISRRLDGLMEKRENLKCQIVKLQDDMPKGNGTSDPVANTYLKISKIDELMSGLADELMDATHYTMEVINAPELTQKERELLQWLYINGLEWKVVRKIMGYSDSQPYKILNAALKKIVDI